MRTKYLGLLVLSLVAHWAPASYATEPITMAQILQLIEARVPDAVIAAEISERGVVGTVDRAFIETARRAGAGPETRAKLEELRPKSDLVISGIPGTRINIDGRPVGQIADDGYLKLEDTPPGQHEVVAELPDHVPHSRSISLDPGQSVEVEIQLDSMYGSLTLTADPPNATISIEGIGRFQGSVENRRIRVGTYVASVEAPFRLPQTEDVEIASGASHTRHVLLELDVAALEAVWDRTQASALRGDHRRTIREANTYVEQAEGMLGADAMAAALAYLANAQLQLGDYANGQESARRALFAAWQSAVSIDTVHHHGLLQSHPARLTVSSTVIVFDPLGNTCNYRRGGLPTAGMQLYGGDPVRVTFPKPDKPQDTFTMNFMDADTARLGALQSLLMHAVFRGREIAREQLESPADPGAGGSPEVSIAPGVVGMWIQRGSDNSLEFRADGTFQIRMEQGATVVDGTFTAEHRSVEFRVGGVLQGRCSISAHRITSSDGTVWEKQSSR